MAKHLTKPKKCCIFASGNSKEERLCRRPPLLHVEDRKQKKNFTEEELSITSTSALSFLPLPLPFPWQTGGLHQPLPYPVP
jgi:hypothetical protein